MNFDIQQCAVCTNCMSASTLVSLLIFWNDAKSYVISIFKVSMKWKARFKCHAKLFGYLHFYFGDLKIILRQKAMPRGELRMLIRISWGPIACFITAAYSLLKSRLTKIEIDPKNIYLFYFPKLKGSFALQSFWLPLTW